MSAYKFRKRRRPRVPFRAWGLALGVSALFFATQRAWPQAVGLAGMWLFYMLRVRLTRCRVETVKRRPCRWLVRGLLGTCDYHIGYKRAFPVLAVQGRFAIPMFMWRLPDFQSPNLTVDSPPQPTQGAEAIAERARQPGVDRITIVVAILSLLVAFASFIRDLIAG